MTRGQLALREQIVGKRGAQAALSRASGVAQDVLSRLCNYPDLVPTLETAAAIERAAGIPATWFTEPADGVDNGQGSPDAA